MSTLTIDFTKPTTRKCGDCQLCCKLLPVDEGYGVGKLGYGGRPLFHTFKKRAGERCQHQRHGKGCAIHGTAAQPMSCQLFRCRWLIGDGTEQLSRPDRAHYVVDMMTDTSRITYDDGRQIDFEVLQIWCDPGYPDAHEDPALRDYIDKQQMPGLVRYGREEGLMLFPPSVTGGEWAIKPTKVWPTQYQYEASKHPTTEN